MYQPLIEGGWKLLRNNTDKLRLQKQRVNLSTAVFRLEVILVFQLDVGLVQLVSLRNYQWVREVELEEDSFSSPVCQLNRVLKVVSISLNFEVKRQIKEVSCYVNVRHHKQLPSVLSLILEVVKSWPDNFLVELHDHCTISQELIFKPNKIFKSHLFMFDILLNVLLL